MGVNLDTPTAGLLTLPEAAAYLGISIRNLRLHLAHKEITHIKLGGRPNSRLRFRVSHLEEFVNRGLVERKKEGI